MKWNPYKSCCSSRLPVPAGLAGAACALAAVLPGCGSTASAGPQPAATVASVAGAAANPVTVSPLPGTPDASPGTQISFLGGQGTRVLSLRVRGSSTGLHLGVLRSYSTGTGQSFLPAQRFREGERVTVLARVLADGRERIARTSFTVAYQVPASPKPWPLANGDPQAVQRYPTLPGVAPTTVSISRRSPSAAVGYLFLAPYQGRGTPGPMIADQSGGLVWFHALAAGQQASNFEVVSWHGKPVLSWWQGRVLELGFGQGQYVLYDSSYRQVAVVRAGNGYLADLHAIRLTPQGTAWVDAYDPVRQSTAAAGGSGNGVLNDCLIQEVDVATGLVMWEWHAFGHIAFKDSHNPAPQGTYPWDFAHVNSLDPGSAGGDVLASFRNTWSVDDIDVHSGGFRWQLGGNHSTFRQEPAAHFYWQHDAEFQPGSQVSLFDNGSTPPEEKESRGLVIALDARAHTARVVHAFHNPYRTLLASSQGGMRPLPGGSWLMGYGGLPNFTEYDPQGQVLLDGTLGREVQNFRAGLFEWHATAPGSPAVLASAAGSGTSVGVSWNGATEVATWRVLAGPSPAALAPAATAPRGGFETHIPLAGAPAYVQVQALDAAGAVIGTSAAVARG